MLIKLVFNFLIYAFTKIKSPVHRLIEEDFVLFLKINDSAKLTLNIILKKCLFIYLTKFTFQAINVDEFQKNIFVQFEKLNRQ